MKEKPAPKHVRRYSEELLACAMQLAEILDHMYRHESEFPDAPPPPVVLCNLLAGTIAHDGTVPASQLKAARKALAKTSVLIERDIFLFEPPPGMNGAPELN
jgi:hypothetical protein